MPAKKTKQTPSGFLSYVHSDDQYGHVSTFRERLSYEAQVQLGQPFPIFQDRNDIGWGQNWKERIVESLNDVTFLIPIITPSFFNSPACREELERFLEREKELKRGDQILPVYYVDSPLVNESKPRAADRLAKVIASRQYADWRDLRFEPFTSPDVGKMLAHLASQIRAAVEREATPRKVRRTRTEARTLNEKASGEPAAVQASTPSEDKSKGAQIASKTEPPTHVVDPMHRGNFATISEAIAAAAPGDRILVRPGLYQEGLVVDKPLEIIGEGELEEIVVQVAGENTLLFKTTMGRVSNLTFRQIGGSSYCVAISQGRLELEGCDISSQGYACVGIYGGADPRLRRNRIHDGKNGGVLVYDNGQGTLEDNDIGNTITGVAIKTGGNPVLRRNRIHEQKSTGVYILENGQGTLEDNEIFANSHAGVTIRTGGKPVLRRNRINKNGYEALWIYDGGLGTFEDNDLRENTRGAWDIAPDCIENVTRIGNLE